MSLLALEHVHKQYRSGARVVQALTDVSLSVQQGELVAIYGARRSGRTSLLRIAAGLDSPDRGTVHYDHAQGRIFVRTGSFTAARQGIVDHVALPLLARGERPDEASRRALEQLDAMGAAEVVGRRTAELDAADLVRVGLAQALATKPRIVMLDDPTREVDLLDREPLMGLVRTIADRGVAVLMTTGEALGVAGADRAITIAEGRLRTDIVAEHAQVVPIRRSSGGG